jgi:hypothetical protein
VPLGRKRRPGTIALFACWFSVLGHESEEIEAEQRRGSSVPLRGVMFTRGMGLSVIPKRHSLGQGEKALESEHDSRQSSAGRGNSEQRAIRRAPRVLEPDGDQLKITLKGDLEGMLSAARDNKRSPDTGDLLFQIKLVAGACNQRYLQLWSGAA